MTPDERNALRQVAEAATIEPWVLDEAGLCAGGYVIQVCPPDAYLGYPDEHLPVAVEDRIRALYDFLTAFDPPTVLALLTQSDTTDRYRQALERIERLEGALRAAEAKIYAALDALGLSGHRVNPAGYTTDAALWLERAVSEIGLALSPDGDAT